MIQVGTGLSPIDTRLHEVVIEEFEWQAEARAETFPNRTKKTNHSDDNNDSEVR